MLGCSRCLFSATFVIGFVAVVGMLLLRDLFPVTEPLCSETDHGCADRYFSLNYFHARTRFRAAAKRCGAGTITKSVYIDPRTGIDYTMDVAIVEGDAALNNSIVLLHTSGVHGVEGFAGSAIQIAALEAFSPGECTRPTPGSPTKIFVHAVNPYGFAELRRFNENNVDLNRNSLTPEELTELVRRDPNIAGYESFRSVFELTSAPTWHTQWTMLFRAVGGLIQHGMPLLKKALVTGQYHDPKGIYFGGNEVQASHTILAGILRPYFDAAFVLSIDVHTGLGPSGVDTLMLNSDEQVRELTPHFGPTAYSIETPTSTNDGASSGYDLARGISTCKHKFSPKAKLWDVTQEFGTVPGIFVARGVILENAAHQFSFGTDMHLRMKLLKKNAFFVQTQAWKNAVLRRGAVVLSEADRMLRGIAASAKSEQP